MIGWEHFSDPESGWWLFAVLVVALVVEWAWGRLYGGRHGD